MRWLLFLILISLTSPLLAAPIAQIDQLERIFPDTQNTTEVYERFIIKNTGDKPLFLSSLSTSCGCTSAAFESQTVAPGKQTFLQMRLDLRGSSGLQVVQATFKTNAPATPNVTLTLKGNAVAFYEIIPRQLIFPPIKLDDQQAEKLTSTASFFASDQTPFEITSISPGKDWLKVAAAPVDGDKSHYKLTFTITPGLAAGMNTADVQLTTNSPKFPAVKIPVVVPVQGPISYSPATLELTLPKTGDPEPVTRNIVLNLNDPDPATLTIKSARMTAAPSDIKITITQSTKRSARVRIANLTPDAKLEGQKLIITVDHPTIKQIEIPITVTMAKSKGP